MGLKFFLFVGLGGGIGSVCRAILAHLLSGQTLLATVLANLGGAFLIGFLAKWGTNFGSGEVFRAFWIVGICGGFTTFSTFGMDLYGLFQRGSWMWGLFYVIANFMGTLLLIWIGFRTAHLTFS